MHSHLTGTDEIDYNLYPALLQVFAIILLGYLAGSFEVISKSQSLGLNKFVGTFALPALLFRNTATLDFSSVNWVFLGGIFLSKTLVFVLAILLTILTIRPVNIGLAAVFAIFVSQSNDFALGFPIVQAIYSDTHPEYLHYIYLIAPISLCILNPIAFLMMEYNEAVYLNKQLDKKEDVSEEDQQAERQLADDLLEEDRFTASVNSVMIQSTDSSDLSNEAKIKSATPKPLSTLQLIKTTVCSTISNPIVFMTIIGIVANFILDKKIPNIIDPILTTLANSFSALALFYLGYTMVGKIRGLKFTTVVIIIILIFTKSLIYPLVNREIILHLIDNIDSTNMTSNDTESMSTFAFLYGTFPSAPSLFFYIAKYTSLDDTLISAALVFGTLVSAPLMMISGHMISFRYNSSSVSNFVDIECKTAYGFSILSFVLCIWVLYIFMASGRGFRRSHFYVVMLVISQLVNSLIHIIWSSITTNVDNLSPAYGYVHVLFALFFAFVTRCVPLCMLFNIISISGISHRSGMFRIIVKLANSRLFLFFLGAALPLITVAACALAGNIPEKQTMIISVGKAQIIISNVLLLLLVMSVVYFGILFVRTKNEHNSFMKFLTVQMNGELESRHKSYYSFSKATAIDNMGIINNNDDREINANLINREDRNQRNFLDNMEEEIDDADTQHLISTPARQDYVYLFDEEADMEKIKNDYQILNQVSLIIILTFNSLMCLFFQMWVLFDEGKSGIYYELELLDITLLYGQGFFTFLIFGLDNEYVFAPAMFKIKEILRMIEPYKATPLDQVPEATIRSCKKFEDRYKLRCRQEIVRNQRFHHRYYLNVFKGSELVTWLLRHRLVRSRKEGELLGKKLIEGRVIAHVSKSRHFYDSFNLYKFEN